MPRQVWIEPKGRLNLRTEPSRIDQHVVLSSSRQSFHVPLYEGFAANQQHGFGSVVSEGSHALATACRQHHDAGQGLNRRAAPIICSRWLKVGF